MEPPGTRSPLDHSTAHGARGNTARSKQGADDRLRIADCGLWMGIGQRAWGIGSEDSGQRIAEDSSFKFQVPSLDLRRNGFYRLPFSVHRLRPTLVSFVVGGETSETGIFSWQRATSFTV